MKVHRSVLANATDEQLRALRDNVLKGKWEHIPDDNIALWSLSGTLMVELIAENGHPFVIGIETDGYTHS